jgi:thymidylate kinase
MSSTKSLRDRPLLIELEGIDGAGKTSAHKTLSDLLTANGIKHIGTREAGNPNIPLCVQLRKMALHDLAIEDHEARECVFAAKRILNRKWYRSLDPTIVVVSDRG